MASNCATFICLITLLLRVALISSSEAPAAMEADRNNELNLQSYHPRKVATTRRSPQLTRSSPSLAASPPISPSAAIASPPQSPILENYFICDPDRLTPCASMGNEVLNGGNPPKSPCCATLRDYLGTTFKSYAYRCIRETWSYYLFGDAPWDVANRVICAAYYYCEQTPIISKLSCENFPLALSA